MAQESEQIALLRKVDQHYGTAWIEAFYSNPVFIVSTPRSGSTLLFELLTKNSGIWSIGGESHGVYDVFPHLRAENADFDSGSLTTQHADPDTTRLMRAGFLYLLHDRDQQRYISLTPAQRPSSVCFLEKTPRNSLNIPFLLKVFPHAKFIFLYRDARQNIGSIIDAWAAGQQTGAFVTFRNLPHWDRDHWCLLLPRGWRAMKGKSIAEIAAFQWRSSNQVILDELEKLPGQRWTTLSYAELTSAPEARLRDLCEFAGVALDPQLQRLVSTALPLSESVVSPPDPDKWKRHEKDILAALPACQETIQRLDQLARQ